MSSQELSFDQIHIDVARNSTDDFNPFHDPRRWKRVAGNPFQSTIALGFQLEFLIADRVGAHRRANGEDALVEKNALHYTNYEFHFASALQTADKFQLEIKKTIEKVSVDSCLSNRVVVRKNNGSRLVLIGTQSETRTPRFLTDETEDVVQASRRFVSRSRARNEKYFHKRKFLNTSNGKNFVLGSLCDQFDYFDVISERVYFPPLFTASLLSSALLEKGWAEGYDFEVDPMVYTSHQISVDNRLQRQLQSNDELHILVEGPLTAPRSKGLGQIAVDQTLYRCFGVTAAPAILFRANVQLAPLHSFLSAD